MYKNFQPKGHLMKTFNNLLSLSLLLLGLQAVAVEQSTKPEDLVPAIQSLKETLIKYDRIHMGIKWANVVLPYPLAKAVQCKFFPQNNIGLEKSFALIAASTLVTAVLAVVAKETIGRPSNEENEKIRDQANRAFSILVGMTKEELAKNDVIYKAVNELNSGIATIKNAEGKHKLNELRSLLFAKYQAR